MAERVARYVLDCSRWGRAPTICLHSMLSSLMPLPLIVPFPTIAANNVDYVLAIVVLACTSRVECTRDEEDLHCRYLDVLLPWLVESQKGDWLKSQFYKCSRYERG